MQQRAKIVFGIGLLAIAAAVVLITVYHVGFSINLTTHFFTHNNASVQNNSTGVYLQQEALTIPTNATILMYNVTIPKGADPTNSSFFLIDGLTDTGFWCQFGIATVNIALANGTRISGPHIVYRVAYPNGAFSYPDLNVLSYAPPSYGDKVLLVMQLKDNVMYLKFNDWTHPNSTPHRVIFFNISASHFVESGMNGEFTGLMSQYAYTTYPTHVLHPMVIYQPAINSSSEWEANAIHGNDATMGIGEINSTTSSTETVYAANMPHLIASNVSVSILNFSGYSELSYPNGTFITK
jgi:hypothetical protein